MDTILILIGIIWLISNVAKKKKRQQEKDEAARQQARKLEDAPAPVATPQRPTIFDPYFDDAAASATGHTPAPAGKPQGIPMPANTQVNTDIRSSSEDRHPLEASSISGHAHMESSLTGFEESCPPTVKPAPQPARKKPAATPASPKTAQRSTFANGESAFRWNADNVAQGIILGEILGKPKALQKRA